MQTIILIDDQNNRLNRLFKQIDVKLFQDNSESNKTMKQLLLEYFIQIMSK